MGKNGELLGAVNVLIDITDGRQAEFLRFQARKCRRLASSVSDSLTADTLNLMASEHDEQASLLGEK